MTKTELLAREILTTLNGGEDPLVSGVGVKSGSVLSMIAADLPLNVIFELILEFIDRLLEIFNTRCPDNPLFSRLVRRAGPFQRLSAVRQWRQMEESRKVHTGLNPWHVVDTARAAALSKSDEWLDEMAAEPTKPDWMFSLGA